MEMQHLFSLDNYQLNKVSYSKIKVFMQCKLRYKYKYIGNNAHRKNQKDQKDMFYLNIGRSLHNVLNILFDPKNKNFESEFINKIFLEKWIPKGFINCEDEKFWKDNTKKLIFDFISKFPANNEILFSEKKFQAQVENLLIESKIDRIDKLKDKSYELIDYKYGDKDIDVKYFERDLQWAFHYLASYNTLKKQHGLDPKIITFYFLEAREKLQIIPSKDKVDAALTKIKNIVDNIENEKQFDPQINKFCVDCRFRNMCPIMKAK